MLVLLIVLWTISAVLIIADPKSRSTRWGSAVAFFSGFGGFGVLLRNYADTLDTGVLKNNYETIVSFIFTLSHQVAPYTLLMFSLVYSGILDNYKYFSKFASLLFFIPVALMYVIFPFIPKYTPSFLVLSIWVVPYVLISNFLLFYAFIKENRPRVRNQKLMTFILIMPATMYSVSTNYILRVFKIDNLWQYNVITISAAFIIFSFAAARYGVMGIRLRFERYCLDNTIKVVSSGTAIFCHTLKNEILKIGLCTNNVKASVNSPKQNLSDINENIGYILKSTEFITNMLKHIQMNMEEIFLIEEIYSLKDLILKSLDMAKFDIKTKQIEVKKYLIDDIFIACDGIHIQEALHNIIRNAIEAMGTGGNLKIAVDLNDRMDVLISISDNGCGISEENLPHICDPFFSTKKTAMNFGLGLSYCFNVMQKHGGTLQIKSSIDKGTTVILAFPKKKLADMEYKSFKGAS